MSGTLYVLGYVLLEGIAILLGIRAIRTARTAQGAAGWAVFLLSVPIVAVPAYLAFGNWRVQGYVVARRRVGLVVEGIRRQGAEHPPHRLPPPLGRASVRAFEKLAGLPVVSGNDMRVLIDGAAAYEAIFAAIEAARRYVLVQVYILRDDALGRDLRDRLIAASGRGVRVVLLFDAVGSYGLPASYVAALQAAGVETANVHAKKGPRLRLQINFRNHRKIVVVDGEVGFTGGLNVGDEYMSRDPVFGRWRDTHCRIEGPMVSQLQLAFAEDWHWATGQALRDGITWDPGTAERNMDGLVVATGPADHEDYGTLYFCALAHAAERRLWIASAYLVPDTEILAALKLAALRGVEVRVLVPEAVDHWLPWLAALAYVDELQGAGVEVWRYTGGFLHQKVAVVDDTIAAVGSHNLDNRSCRLNFEATAVMFDATAAAEVAAMLEEDFAQAFRLESGLAERPIWQRTAAPVARLFAPLL